MENFKVIIVEDVPLELKVQRVSSRMIFQRLKSSVLPRAK